MRVSFIFYSVLEYLRLICLHYNIDRHQKFDATLRKWRAGGNFLVFIGIVIKKGIQKSVFNSTLCGILPILENNWVMWMIASLLQKMDPKTKLGCLWEAGQEMRPGLGAHNYEGRKKKTPIIFFSWRKLDWWDLSWKHFAVVLAILWKVILKQNRNSLPAYKL